MLVVSAPEHATEELTYVMEHAKDPELAMIARLRLARVLAYREKYDDALKTLEGRQARQVRGPLNEVAATSRTRAATSRRRARRISRPWSPTAPSCSIAIFLQMKLNDLPGGSRAGRRPADAGPDVRAARRRRATGRGPGPGRRERGGRVTLRYSSKWLLATLSVVAFALGCSGKKEKAEPPGEARRLQVDARRTSRLEH